MTKNNIAVKKYFPNFTTKVITFSIDDGSPKYDDMFLDIVRPSGIKGTFNLYFGLQRYSTNEEYILRYEGYEIANHCNRHPFAINPEKVYSFTEEPFDRETADKSLVYRTDREGLFLIWHGRYWATVATREVYLQLAEEGRRDIDSIFGKGTVKGFVWPYGAQNDKELHKALSESGYQYIRKTYTPGFSMPKDRMAWGYNASSENLDSKILEFDALEDDGELKFFCFGVHSVDFETQGKWDVLRDFVKKYGNRPNDFWYAGVSEIFEYEDALNMLEIEGNTVNNLSNKELYVSINSKKLTIPPKTKISI